MKHSQQLKKGFALFAAAGAMIICGLSTASAALINVNINGFTPSRLAPFPVETEALLEGPGGGLGTSWNQFAANSGAGLVDSTGGATGVSFTTNFSEGRYDGTSPSQRMMRATLTDFGRGQTRTLAINGLTAGSLYNVWLVSHRNQNGAAPNYRERQVGTWTATNPTTSTVAQLVDGRLSGGSPNGGTFVLGTNYAYFENVEADGSGNITFRGQGARIIDQFPDDYRLHLNGFQIEEATAPIPEPSTTALLGLGGLALALRRRK